MWKHLIRLETASGDVCFGDACVSSAEQLVASLQDGELRAKRLKGHSPFHLEATDEEVRVKRLLGVLTPDDVPIVKCIGLNYKAHVSELGRKPPPYPSLFMKPSPAIAAFDQDILVPRAAQDMDLDYEGELAIIIGRTGKDIPQKEALSYVAGYASSNDVSSRKWQRDPAYAGHIPQWSFGKSFDSFAPLGPMIVSPAMVEDAGDLLLRTIVNGEVRQETNTSDLLFGVKALISFLSQGSTLQEGTVIMTGTPGGVALGMKDPKWLVDGDIVEVQIEHLGSCKNRVVFANSHHL